MKGKYGRSIYRKHRVFEALKEQGRTIAWFCREMPCDYSHLYHVKAGRRGVSRHFAKRAAALLGVHVNDLFYDVIPADQRSHFGTAISTPPKKRPLRVADRFWLHVEHENGDACREWLRSRNHVTGYGRLRFKDAEAYAHQIAYTLAFGPIPDGLWVLHTCDNPACCNPRHLYAGTASDNAQDRERRGRRNLTLVQGENSPRAVLREVDVHDIRWHLSQGRTSEEISSRYGVSAAAVFSIKYGRSWSHVTDEQDVAA